MKRAFSVFTFLLCLGMLLGLPNPLQAAKKKKLILVENDENVNDPDYCVVPVAFCLQYGSIDTLELTLSTLNQQRPRIEVAIINPDNGAVIWQSIPSNITLIGPNAMSATSFTFEVVLDLSMTFGNDDRYKIRVVGYDNSIGSISTGGGGGGGSNTNNGFPDYIFQGAVVCVKNQCTIRSSCPCDGKGSGSLGFLAGQQVPQFDPPGVIGGKVGLNTNNKFIGIQYNTFAKGLYYQAELQLSQLTFLADDTMRSPAGSAPMVETQTHALNHLYLVPLQLRLRLGRFASVGVGGAISYVFNYQIDQVETVFPGSGGDKIEPELFGDIRLGNAQGGLQVGYRFSRHWSGLDDLTGDRYRLGKVYLSYTF